MEDRSIYTCTSNDRRATDLQLLALADLEGGGVTGLNPPPFQISKIKESNKTKQIIEDNPLEKEVERKSCMFV